MKQLVTTLNEYKEVYNTRLEIYLIQYVDYSEKDFIDKEIIYFDNCLQTSKIENRLRIWSYKFSKHQKI